MPPAGAKKKAAPKAHKLAVQFPKGEKLKDLFKKEWLLADVVGKGGFGLIYLATQVSDSKNKTQYVTKIEPKSNGPLFCEMTFYQRIGKKDQIQGFVSKHKLKYLPVPPFISTGSHEYKSSEYRFLVMPRYGTDLQKLLVESGGTFPAKVVFSVGLRMLDALQYLHENEYVHADVKAANILQGFHEGKLITDQVYLVDYGLAYRYTVDGKHKVYKEDPRLAHDGTIEFTSRDSHKGVSPSRRADLEILSYCLLQWMSGSLPWENKLTDPVYVASCKEKFFSSLSKSVNSCFSGAANPNAVYTDTLVKLMEHVKGLSYDATPDYSKLRNLFKDGLKREGQKNEWSIDFVSAQPKALKRKSGDASTASPVPKKTKASPVKKPTSSPKKATPKKRIITPMTPKSPAAKSPKSPVKKAPASRNGSAVKSKPAPKKERASPVKKISKQDTPMASPSPRKNGTTSTNGTRRTVKRRVDVMRSDASAQTSPGLAKKS